MIARRMGEGRGLMFGKTLMMMVVVTEMTKSRTSTMMISYSQ